MERDDKHRRPWDRRLNESGVAFRAFHTYRDMPVERRTHAEVVRLLERKPSYVRMVQKWASKHDWRDRVGDWDDHQDRLRQRALSRTVIRMAEKHAEVASEAIQLCSLKLKATLRKVQTRITQSNGEDFDVPGLSLGVVPNLLTAAANLERVSRGEPSTVQALQVEEKIMIPKPLSTEEHAAMIARLRREGRLPGATSQTSPEN